MTDPGNGGSPEIGGTPSTGMFFYHQNLLGSTDMLTDRTGNVTTGAGQEGASHVSYKPYGEIDRADSSGPDIFSYKYTGQIEDTPTELYYYKSRYYDPVLGRFIQPDSIVEPGNLFGMNQYMYVNGNPINYNDPTGNSSEIIHEINKWIRDTIHSFNHLGGEHHSTAFFPQMSDYVNGQVGQTTKWNTTQWAIIGIAIAASIATDGALAPAIEDMSEGSLLTYFGVAGVAGIVVTVGFALGGYLLGRGIGGFDHANIHSAGWDSQSANNNGYFGMQNSPLIFEAVDAGLGLYEMVSTDREIIERASRAEYFQVRREAVSAVNSRNVSFHSIELMKKSFAPYYNVAIRHAVGIIASNYILNITYGHLVGMGVDKVKEAFGLGEKPEHESYIEEQSREYLLDRIHESLTE
ncbi:RHS repeat-associated core domain-containing protein [Leptospira wolffii]|nr:RHS repeat-associated core domain-containing protein [Leptospira wolffii]